MLISAIFHSQKFTIFQQNTNENVVRWRKDSWMEWRKKDTNTRKLEKRVWYKYNEEIVKGKNYNR